MLTNSSSSPCNKSRPWPRLEEKDLRDKELDKPKAVAQAIVDMVDPPENGVGQAKTLLERLQGAPQKIVSISRTPPGNMCHMF